MLIATILELKEVCHQQINKFKKHIKYEDNIE